MWGLNSGFVGLKIERELVSLGCDVMACRRDVMHECVL